MPCLEAADFAVMRDLRITTEESLALRAHVLGCERCQELERSLLPLLRWMPGCFTAGSGERGPDCRDPLELVDLVRGNLDGERARRVRAHAADCGRCAADLAEILIGRAVARPAPEPLAATAATRALRLVEQPPPSGARPRHWRWAASLAVAASLAGLAILQNVGELPVTTAPTPTATGADRTARSPLPAPILLKPIEGQQLPQSGLEIRWQTMAGARSYQATLLDDRGRTVWRGSSDTGALTVPPGVVLQPGSRYFAVVAARLEDGSTARAPAVAFFVAPVTGP